MRKAYLLLLSSLLVFLLILTSACGAKSGGSSSETDKGTEQKQEEAAKEESKEPVKVKMRLSWLVKGEYAPLFVALEKGWFKEEGIDMEIVEGSEKAIPTQLLINGEDQFSYIAADDVVRARAKGMPVKMVANVLQRTPQVVMALPEVKMDGPQDMAGKTIVDTAGGTLNQILKAFLKANNVDPNSVKVIIADWGAKNTAFLNGDVDMMSGYATNDLAALQVQTGKPFNYFSVADYGFNMIAHGVVASEEYIKNNPEIVQSVVKAVQKGVEWTVQNPGEAADIMAKLFPDKLKPEVTKVQVAETVKLFRNENTKDHPYGWMSDQDWALLTKILFENGGVDKIDEDVNNYFSNEFIK